MEDLDVKGFKKTGVIMQGFDILDEKVLGLEACVWTEYVKDQKQLEFQAFPRLIAVAETGWTFKENKDYQSFLTRLNDFIQRLSLHDVNYPPKEIYLKDEAGS